MPFELIRQQAPNVRDEFPKCVYVCAFDGSTIVSNTGLRCDHRAGYSTSALFHLFLKYPRSVVIASVTRSGDLLDIGQLFKAIGSN